jgi:hypothetical protein
VVNEQPKEIETLRPVAATHPTPQSKDSAAPEDRTWWGRYARSIARLPEDTRAVIADDAQYIADAAVPTSADGTVDCGAYGVDRIRTGIVVGSVQSGKTASMLAVAALLLDRGVDLIVVLAGTRVALWLQTFERLLAQLDGSTLATHWERSQVRTLVPQPDDILAGDERVDPYRYLRGARLRVRSALRLGHPSIIVVPKEDDHLIALANFLGEQASADCANSRGRPILTTVLDDEADDASILDAREGSRITPQFIQNLWASKHSAPSTRHEGLFASYVAYTATPQANYLQRYHNPLTPRSFHAALRLPGDRGARSPRTVSYTERRGLTAYYTGGDAYYVRLRDLPGDLCVGYPFPEDDENPEVQGSQYEATRWRMIGDAMRAYFVAGAVRLLLANRRFVLMPRVPVARADLDATVPPTHSMLYHPSALKEAHFVGAQDLVRWSLSTSADDRVAAIPTDEWGEPRLAFDADALRRRLDSEETLWQAWLSSFSSTASALSSLPGACELTLSGINWAEVRELLIEEVFPNVRLRVLNSDPRADDRPRFEPEQPDVTADAWLPPSDVFTVFVAGNVLSRGLTIEGLCTSLFLRGAREPSADTQMQMQRWFGYRGRHLPFCRVFLFQDQLALFRQYHRNDEALKVEILNHMDGHRQPFRDGVLVLQGDRFRATGKVDSRRVPLHPGPTPSIRLVERAASQFYAHNIQQVQSLLDHRAWMELRYPESEVRGLIAEQPLTMLGVADLLDSFRYTAHDPSIELEVSQRWVSLERALKLDVPLFCPPRINPGEMTVDPSSCPYSIAAYLRLWHTAISRHDMPGLQPTDDPGKPWSLLNLAAYRRDAPHFHLGIRFGSEGPTVHSAWNGQRLRMMRRRLADGKPYLLETLWGSRNPTERWRGDQAFDYHYYDPAGAHKLLEEGAWRPRGQPGLVLIHLVADPASGSEMVAIGLGLPHGGPDHVAALRVGAED